MHTLPNKELLAIWSDRLAGLGFASDLDGLRAAGRGDAPDARGMAFMFIALGDHKEALGDVLVGLEDSYPPARAEAARAAAMLGHGAGLETLHALLGSDWQETAINAAAYLADLGDNTGWPVIAAAAAGTLESLRLQAALLARAFATWSEPGGAIDVAGLLSKAALHDPSALVRRSALSQVAGLGDAVMTADERRRILDGGTNDADPQVARTATRHLQELA